MSQKRTVKLTLNTGRTKVTVTAKIETSVMWSPDEMNRIKRSLSSELMKGIANTHSLNCYISDIEKR